MRNKLEIFVLTYNRVNYLKDCLRSILNQTFRDFKLVVLDNASEQDVAGLVKSFGDTRLQLIVNSSNIGPAANWLKAHDLASSESDYFMIFFDDDCMPPNMLACQLQVFREHPHLSFVSTGVNLVYEDAVMLDFPGADECSFEVFQSPDELLDALFNPRVFGVFGFGSIMYRTRIAKQNRPDVERFANLGDRPYMLSLSKLSPCAYLVKPIINARQHAEQDSAGRAWSYIHEIEVGRFYLDVSHRLDRSSLNKTVMKQLVQSLVVHRPRVPLRSWLKQLKERDMLYWKPLLVYLPYYWLRNVFIRQVRARAPALYQRYVQARALPRQ